jgi:dUTP pyrophosphatase
MSTRERKLLICPTARSYSFYESHDTFHEGDAGLDLFTLNDITIGGGETGFIDFEISCQMVVMEGKEEESKNKVCYESYFLYARSSISKTPLILHNSVGIIDACYTGNIIGAFRNLSDKPYTVKSGTRLVQICARNLEPFDIKIVDVLRNTSRGSGGFGSSGK